MRKTLAIAALLAAAPTAFAADLAVGKKKPYAKIQDAVNAARDGDRILVGPGVYKEAVAFGTLNHVTFLGRGAVWDGQTGPRQSGTCLSGSGEGIVVQGFTFRQGESHVSLQGKSCVVTKCVSRGAGSYAFYLRGDGMRVEACKIVGDASPGVYVDGAGAVVRSNQIRNGDSGGIDVSGASALVEKNEIRTIEDAFGVRVYGADAKVLTNVVWNTDDENIYVEGDRAQIVGNRCTYTSDGPGVSVYGNSAEVGKNKVFAPAEGGVRVNGDAANVHDNVVSMTLEGYAGIQLTGVAKGGGGTVACNVVSDTTSWGFDLRADGLTVTGNTALRCGPGRAGAFHVVGNSNTIDACVATSSRATGFLLEGDGTKVTDSTASGGTGDGFRVIGQATQMSGVVATGNGGEGLDNRGVLTAASGCTLTGNRLDVACDVGSGASFDGGLAGNTFKTGGETQTPEVDN